MPQNVTNGLNKHTLLLTKIFTENVRNEVNNLSSNPRSVTFMSEIVKTKFI